MESTNKLTNIQHTNGTMSGSKRITLNDDPDKLLNEWLGELENLIGGLDITAASLGNVSQTAKIPSTTSVISSQLNQSTSVVTTTGQHQQQQLQPTVVVATTPATVATNSFLRPRNSRTERSNSYRISMANLEETHEAELDAILGELSLLEQKSDGRLMHSRTNSMITTNSTISSAESGNGSSHGSDSSGQLREPRTESPDNDSAFSDTVSLLSSESSTSSGIGSGHFKNIQHNNANLFHADSTKAEKIHLALQKLEQASVRRLFVKAFSADGASKSLLVDERMTCGYVTRLLADKNHIPMEPHWALVEHLPDLQMERLFEDHELLVDNLMNWSPDSKNRVLFLQRHDKVGLFNTPEIYLPGTQMAPGSEHDDHTRAMLIEEFFTNGNSQITMEGPLYMKSDAKKGWKRYHFVLRASGLYYFPKEKTRSPRDLVCFALFNDHDIYKGLSWKKKHKAPSEYTFGLHSNTTATVPATKSSNRSSTFVKMLCADDGETLEKWVTAARIAKYGRQVYDNHKTLLDDLAREELDKFSSARSGSIGSIISTVPSQCSSSSSGSGGSTNQQTNGRLSRASSSSSSGCLSDENNGFDTEFPTGTIKRKPSMKPNLPLTSMTRQLKEVGENTVVTSDDSSVTNSPERGGTLTRRNRRRSEESIGNGTLKRRHPNQSNRGSIESMSSTSTLNTPTAPDTPTKSLIHSPTMYHNNNNVMQLPPPVTTNGTHALNNNNTEESCEPPVVINQNLLSPLGTMPSCMTDSTFSLPPPPEDLEVTSLSGSTFSLDSLPPPPPPCELENAAFPDPPLHPMVDMPDNKQIINSNIYGFANMNCNQPIVQKQPMHTPPPHLCMPPASYNVKTLPSNLPSVEQRKDIIPPVIYAKTMKPSIIKGPPYKAPPPYANGGNQKSDVPVSPSPSSTIKSVSFADSPVLLRRKVYFEDQVPVSPRRCSSRCSDSSSTGSNAPPPPPRSDATRLSSVSQTSPKRLSESQSNPPREFLKDLQRVMRKKWQVAQKCKLDTTTSPHEVLGFRDFNGELSPDHSSHYYRESSNVSNWVQEHYGMDSLYENLGENMGTEPISQQPYAGQTVLIKKRPPPPPPRRSESTQLTHRI